jgi:serine/threonine-protein kinase
LALEAAEHALELATTRDAAFLDTLAAAQANAGQFDEAVATSKKLLESITDTELRTAVEARLELYRNQKPYRQDAP